MISASDDLAIARLAQGMREQIYPRWELLVAAPERLASIVRQALRAKGLHSFRIVVAANDMSSTLGALLTESSGPYILKIPDGALLRNIFHTLPRPEPDSRLPRRKAS